MSTTKDTTADVVAAVSKLKITPEAKKSVAKPKSTKGKKEPIDSWEDEELSESESDAGSEKGQPAGSSVGTAAGTQAPPPTPISPTYGPTSAAVFPSSLSAAVNTPASPRAPTSPAATSDEPKRPEKTDAVARRMIASALGVKVPKQTEEQKAYDRAMREKERKRKEEEREAEKKRQEEVDRARRAVWED